MATSGGSASTYENGAAPTCYCQAKCVISISMTKKNPNRRFFGCPYYDKKKMKHCDYFMWEDKFIASQQATINYHNERDMEAMEIQIKDMEDMKIQMNEDMEAMKIQMIKDVKAKINQLERDTEHKVNIIEWDIEAMKLQMARKISVDDVLFDIKHLSLHGK